MTDHDTSIAGRPLLRVVAYYIFLAAVIVLLTRFAPEVMSRLSPGTWWSPATSTRCRAAAQAAAQARGMQPGSVAVAAMAAAVLLMLPVVWVYILTRQKKGYQQSLVQTLIILPIVVVGRRDPGATTASALAFALGGIVGAVAFRNRLGDTKDAVYVFLSIARGPGRGRAGLPHRGRCCRSSSTS